MFKNYPTIHKIVGTAFGVGTKDGGGCDSDTFQGKCFNSFGQSRRSLFRLQGVLSIFQK